VYNLVWPGNFEIISIGTPFERVTVVVKVCLAA